jgi:hypothetical protein
MGPSQISCVDEFFERETKGNGLKNLGDQS